MEQVVVAMIGAVPGTLMAMLAWRETRRTHGCLEDHIVATAAHHALRLPVSGEHPQGLTSDASEGDA